MPLPAVREFLAAAHGFLNKGMRPDSLFLTMPLLKAYVDELSKDYAGHREHLREAVRVELDRGLEMITRGVEEAAALLTTSARDIARWDRSAAMKLAEACRDLRGGGQIMGFYLDLRRKWRLREEERYGRFAIPFTGTELQMILEEARSKPQEWSQLRQLAGVLLKERFEAPWEGMARDLLVRPSALPTLRREVDKALDDLRKVLSSEASTLDKFEESLEHLSRAFSDLGAAALVPRDDDELSLKALEVVKGILSSIVPDFALGDLIREIRVAHGELPADAEEAWRGYLANGTRGSLLEGLEAFLDCLSGSQDGRDPASLCLFCGAPNSPGSRVCIKCGARLLFSRPGQSHSRLCVVEGEVLKLPAAAEPLADLLDAWRSGAFDSAAAAGALEMYFSTLEKTREQIWREGAPTGEKAALLEALDRFEEAGREAVAALEGEDPRAFRQALESIAAVARETAPGE
jgi:hypothetical protein